MKKSKYIVIIDYLLLYLLLGQSSTPFLVGEIFLVIGFLFSLFIFFRRKLCIDREVIWFSVIFFLLFIAHVFISLSFNATVFIAFFMRIFFAYFVVKILNKNFIDYFIKTILFFTLISFVFYVPIFFFSGFEDLLTAKVTPFFYKYTYFQDYQHLIIFTINTASKTIFPRNPGPFWEAGGFGVFLNIALIFNLLKENKILSINNLVFLFAIITTQSTGTYFAAFFTILSFLIYSGKMSYSIILLPILVFIGYTYFNELPFLGEKVTTQFEEAKEDDVGGNTRFKSARLDFEEFLDSPLAGEGRFKEINSNADAETIHGSKEYRNNGTTRLLAEFGFFGFLTYFLFYLKSIKHYCFSQNINLKISYIILLVFIMIGFSQVIFTKPFFFSFCFLGTVYLKNIKDKHTDINTFNV